MTNPNLIRGAGHVFGALLPRHAAGWAERLTTHPRLRRETRMPAAAVPVTFRYGLTGYRFGQHGPAVLALHGWEGSAGQFSALGETIAAAGGQLYALEGPGHGRSTAREAHPGLFADALLEAAGEIGPLIAVTGHSMGAGAALIALDAGLDAERAVLIAGPAGFRGMLQRIGRDLGLPGRARRAFLARMEARTGQSLAAFSAPHLLPRIEQPLLIVHDREDRVVPFREAEELVRHTRGAELLATRGLGHGRILQDPETVARMREFVMTGA